MHWPRHLSFPSASSWPPPAAATWGRPVRPRRRQQTGRGVREPRRRGRRQRRHRFGQRAPACGPGGSAGGTCDADRRYDRRGAPRLAGGGRAARLSDDPVRLARDRWSGRGRRAPPRPTAAAGRGVGSRASPPTAAPVGPGWNRRAVPASPNAPRPAPGACVDHRLGARAYGRGGPDDRRARQQRDQAGGRAGCHGGAPRCRRARPSRATRRSPAAGPTGSWESISRRMAASSGRSREPSPTRAKHGSGACTESHVTFDWAEFDCEAVRLRFRGGDAGGRRPNPAAHGRPARDRARPATSRPTPSPWRPPRWTAPS